MSEPTPLEIEKEAANRIGRTARERARLRQAWAEGIESGDAGVLDFADLKAEARHRLTERAKR